MAECTQSKGLAHKLHTRNNIYVWYVTTSLRQRNSLFPTSWWFLLSVISFLSSFVLFSYALDEVLFSTSKKSQTNNYAFHPFMREHVSSSPTISHSHINIVRGSHFKTYFYERQKTTMHHAHKHTSAHMQKKLWKKKCGINSKKQMQEHMKKNRLICIIFWTPHPQ